MIVRIMGICSVVLIILLDCDPSSHNPVVAEPPQFSNLTSLANHVFVAYESPNPLLKPDTIKVSFNYQGIDFSAIVPTATLDSGKSWIPIEHIDQLGENAASVVWVPRHDPSGFEYCGKKQCQIKLTDTVNDVSLESDQFAIIGSRALWLDAPLPNDTFSLDDTIAVTYITNTDMVSNVQVFFTYDSTVDWFEITGTTTRLNDESPIKTMRTLFLPLKYAANIPDAPSIPICFLLRDYNSPLQSGRVISGTIILQRQ